jgi:hypothetical protein
VSTLVIQKYTEHEVFGLQGLSIHEKWSVTPALCMNASVKEQKTNSELITHDILVPFKLP